MSAQVANERLTIKGYRDKQVARKLVSMGILPGMTMKIVRISPFGRSFYIKVGNQIVAMRKDEYDQIVFE